MLLVVAGGSFGRMSLNVLVPGLPEGEAVAEGSFAATALLFWRAVRTSQKLRCSIFPLYCLGSFDWMCRPSVFVHPSENFLPKLRRSSIIGVVPTRIR
jgi:hypothetical protein